MCGTEQRAGNMPRAMASPAGVCRLGSAAQVQNGGELSGCTEAQQATKCARWLREKRAEPTTTAQSLTVGGPTLLWAPVRLSSDTARSRTWPPLPPGDPPGSGTSMAASICPSEACAGSSTCDEAPCTVERQVNRETLEIWARPPGASDHSSLPSCRIITGKLPSGTTAAAVPAGFAQFHGVNAPRTGHQIWAPC